MALIRSALDGSSDMALFYHVEDGTGFAELLPLGNGVGDGEGAGKASPVTQRRTFEMSIPSGSCGGGVTPGEMVVFVQFVPSA